MTTLDMSTVPVFPTRVILDTEEDIHGSSATESMIARAPFALEIAKLDASTTVVVKASVSGDTYVNLQSYAEGTTPALLTFPVRYNFVKASVTGAGNVKIVTQG